jgi:hypothetical protein
MAFTCFAVNKWRVKSFLLLVLMSQLSQQKTWDFTGDFVTIFIYIGDKKIPKFF